MNYESCMSHTHACCISYDSEFYEDYDAKKILKIRPRKRDLCMI